MHFVAHQKPPKKKAATHPVVCFLVVLALSVSLSSTAHAAGCAHRTENTANGLDPFGNPLASNVLKVYSGGEFRYYVLPEGKPCNGPNCKGAPPKNMSAVPPVISTERCDLTFLTNNEGVWSGAIL